jgi:hypothetical protein
MDKSMKSVDKCWNDSLSFMDNIYVKVVLYVVLILFSSTYFENINIYFGNLHKNYKFLNIVVLLLIVYLGRKCPVIGILLGISYVISLNYMSSKENFIPTFFGNNNYNNERFTSGTAGADDSNGADENEEQINDNAYTPDVILGDSSDDNVENFFPGLMSNNDEKDSQSFNVAKKDSSDCKSLYTPQYESVGDVCNTVNTFKDELNAQGLNSPEGFNSNVMGSPL